MGNAGGVSFIDGLRSPSKLFFRKREPDDLRSPKRSLDFVRLIRDPKEVVRRAESEREGCSSADMVIVDRFGDIADISQVATALDCRFALL